MENGDCGGRADRFAAYLADLASVLGDTRRYAAMISYCTGLLLPSERKSVEPIAALTAPARTAAQHQSLLHFVGQGDWSDAAVMERIRAHTLPRIETHGAISAWIVDDTGFPKKGKHSVGVARQYCGQLGKQDNCQVAVSLSIANDHASLPVAYHLYLPQSWANDDERRTKAGVPKDVQFKTKPQIALDQIKWACETGLPRGVVVIDAGYGVDAKLRSEIGALKLRYVASVKTTTTVWPPEGRRRGRAGMPISVEKLALALPRAVGRQFAGVMARMRCCRRASLVSESVPRTIAMLREERFPGMAVDRMAAQRGSADEILVIDIAGKYHIRPSCAHSKTAMAH
jgi:SRSO17 transposase